MLKIGDTTAELSVGGTYPDQLHAPCDHLIVDNVYRALRGSGYHHLVKLQAFSLQGRVTLQGCVPSYYLKQVAQTVLIPIEGIRDIKNNLKVVASN